MTTLRLNIRGRLMLLVAVALLPVAGLLAYRAVEDRRRAVRDAQQHALHVARVATAEQRRVVDGARQLLTGVALAPVLSSGDRTAVEAFLNRLRGQHARYANFLLAGADGRVLASAAALGVDADLSERPYFARAVRTRAFAFSNYQLGRASLRPQLELAHPVLGPGGELRGVAIAAIDLAWLQEFVGTLRPPDGTTVTAVDRRGVVLARSGAGRSGEDAGRWIGRPVENSPLMRAAAGRDEGIERLPDFDGEDALSAFATLHEEGGGGGGADAYVFVSVPADVALADARRTALRDALAIGAAWLLAGLLAWFGGGILVVRRVQRLAAAADRVAAGDLAATVADGGSDEIGRLAAVFDRMVPKLRSHLDLQQSLALAMQVQQSLLPAADPAAGGPLDIASRSLYCDATGGDYFDYIDVSEPAPGVVLIAVGDVTGHGIAAALLMASARAALRVEAPDAGRLATLMGRVNRVLSADNRHNRFMTMALVRVDPARGTIRWASAGHDPAILYHPADDRFEDLDGADIPLGIDGTTVYEEYGYVGLRPGDVLVIGTDGIWETFDAAGDMFGKERLRAVIREAAGRPAKVLAGAIEDRLATFRGDAKVLDDVTFVVVRVVGSE